MHETLLPDLVLELLDTVVAPVWNEITKYFSDFNKDIIQYVENLLM